MTEVSKHLDGIEATRPESVNNGGPGYRNRAQAPRARAMPMIVCDSRFLSDTVLELALLKEDGGRLPFTPGQFCNIAIPKNEDWVERSYSIATCTADPVENRIYKIAVSPVKSGTATRYLFNLKVGDIVHASGPFGHLILPKTDPQRYVLVGTGTGVSPYRAMLPELLRRSLHARIEAVLVMGERTRRDLIYAEEFRSFAERHAWFRFIACYSRESVQLLQAHERRGRVQVVREELSLTPERDRVYLCGHPDMVDDWAQALKAAGFSSHALVREKYVSNKSRRPPSGLS